MNSKKHEFCVGDTVYFYSCSGITTVILERSYIKDFPLKVKEYSLTKYGYAYGSNVPCIFPYNKEYYQKLSNLLGKYSDKIPKPDSAYKTYIKKFFTYEKEKQLVVYVSDISEESAIEKQKVAIINRFNLDKNLYTTIEGNKYYYAVPITRYGRPVKCNFEDELEE